MATIVERRVNGPREMYLGDRYKWLGNEVRGIYDVAIIAPHPSTLIYDRSMSVNRNENLSPIPKGTKISLGAIKLHQYAISGFANLE